VVTVMAEVGIDLGDRVPRRIDEAELNACAVVVTMGCSTLELDADVAVRDWALDDPHGQDLQAVRAIRDEIRERVAALLDELLVDLRA
jgi:protein-tyrosine-phosphatase